MSGNKVIKLKKPKIRPFYIPMALEIFIGFIPFLLLGSWYLSRLIGELSSYESGLIWITMEQMVEKEYYYLGEMLNDEQLEKVDLILKYEEDSLSVHYRDASETMISGVEKINTVDDMDNVQVRYLFIGDDGNLYEIDVMDRELSKITADNYYYEHFSGILEKVKDHESRVRSFYEVGGTKYYECLKFLKTSKSICFGSRMLADGSKDNYILVSGQIPSYATEQNADYFRLWIDKILILVIALICGIVCFTVFWSFRGVMKIMGLMEAVCRENSEFPHFSSNLLDEGDEPEVRDLIENFQLMLLSIQKYQDSISSIHEIYESLLPAAFLALFRREDIREIRPGDQACVWGRVVSVRFVSSDEKAQEFLYGRNKLISRILDLLASREMIVTELEYDRISALQLKRNETEKSSLLNISHLIRTLDKTDSGVNEIIVTDTEGEFCYTVTGAPGHMAIRMEEISEEARESDDIVEI